MDPGMGTALNALLDTTSDIIYCDSDSRLTCCLYMVGSELCIINTALRLRHFLIAHGGSGGVLY